MSDAEKIKNYERSYESMWTEINRSRRVRDDALKIHDVARDLVIALRHDMGGLPETKVSIRTMEALNRLQSRLADHELMPATPESST